MSEVIIIGIDLAKRIFQLHGARCNGSVVPSLEKISGWTGRCQTVPATPTT